MLTLGVIALAGTSSELFQVGFLFGLRSVISTCIRK